MPKVGGTNSRFEALLTEDKAAHLVSKLLDLSGIGSCAKALRQREKCFFFFLLCFEPLFNQFDQHAVITHSFLLSNSSDTLRQLHR